jgi:Transposase DDE domain
MTRESLLLNRDWQGIVVRLGGATALDKSAHEAKAFLRRRAFKTATDLLRMVLAYCLGEAGLRSTATWAAAVGLVDVSDVALLKRLRRCGDWLGVLVGRALADAAPPAARGRLIRLVDATVVPKAGAKARKAGKLWRIHSAFDLPYERFGHFELTDQTGGEQLDRIPVVKGEIRIGDRAYMQPDRIAVVMQDGGDVLVRAGWNSARWLDAEGELFDLIAALRKASDTDVLDQPIWVGRHKGPPLALRLIAIKKPPQACTEARRKARLDAKRHGNTVSQETLDAADWVIVVTSLDPEAFSTADILALYRLRWRIELGFKPLKSLVGVRAPPGIDERSARPWLLAHLLMIVLLEPSVDALEDSPRWALVA